MNHAQFWGGGGAASYAIEQSLRFDGSSGLTRTHSNNNTSSDFTLSMWFKKAYNGENNIMLFHTNTDPRYSYVTFGESSGDADLLIARGTSSGYAFNTSRKYRDNSAWYHIVLSVDIGTVTKGYVNGVLDQNTGATSGWYLNGTDPLGLGRTAVGSNYFQGYIAEVHFIDGQALDADSFGEFDDNGVWRPIEYTGSHGSNGFYLKFDPTASNGVGHDHSGNGNNWTASGFTTSGTGTDVMDDTPTTNWCTLNPLTKDSNTTLSEGNLRAAGSSSTAYGTNTQATFAQSSGKWYYEANYVSSSSTLEALGWARTSLLPTSNPTTNGGLVYRAKEGDYFDLSGTNLTSKPTTSTGSVIQVAIDFDAGKIWFGSGGTWFNSGDPAAGSNAAMTFTGGAEELSPCVRALAATFEFNFGQRAFAYTPPTGFKALNTSNLPAPTIKDGSDYFNTILYSGDESSPRALTGVGFQPDFVWIKCRNLTADHNLNDAVRGTGNVLATNKTDSENNAYGYVSAFSSDGFSISDGGTGNGEVNSGSGTYVAWNWLAANGTSSNTAGSITSTVSANASAGFSIVSYTGVAGDNISATVGHGLGVAPDLIIIKNRDWASSGAAWQTYHSALPSTGTSPVRLSQSLSLDTTSAASGNDFKDQMNNTLPTSTVFSVSSHDGVSAANRYRTYGRADDYIAYCFAEVEGYSKFGSYTGNNSSDGPFVYCGFKPRWIMRKATGDTSNWVILDTARDTYNETDNMLLPNTSGTESDGSDIDILSNGFKMRSAALNGSTPYIFAAFAENPFGGSGVSPATAR